MFVYFIESVLLLNKELTLKMIDLYKHLGPSSKELESWLPYAQIYAPSPNQGTELHPDDAIKLPNYYQN